MLPLCDPPRVRPSGRWRSTARRAGSCNERERGLPPTWSSGRAPVRRHRARPSAPGQVRGRPRQWRGGFAALLVELFGGVPAWNGGYNVSPLARPHAQIHITRQDAAAWLGHPRAAFADVGDEDAACGKWWPGCGPWRRHWSTQERHRGKGAKREARYGPSSRRHRGRDEGRPRRAPRRAGRTPPCRGAVGSGLGGRASRRSGQGPRRHRRRARRTGHRREQAGVGR